MHPSLPVNQEVYEDPFIYIIILMSTSPVTTETQPVTTLCIKKAIYDTINGDSSHDLILDFCHEMWPILDLTALLAHLILKTADSLVSFTSSVCSNENLQGLEFPKCISLLWVCLLNRMLSFLPNQKKSAPNASNVHCQWSCLSYLKYNLPRIFSIYALVLFFVFPLCPVCSFYMSDKAHTHQVHT